MAKDIRVNFGDIFQEHFQKLTESNFKITMLQPRFLPSDFRRWKQELNLKTITNHTINLSKVRLFGSNKKQLFFVPSLQFSEKKALVCKFQIKSIVDTCLIILEYSDLIDKKNWLYRKLYQLALEHYYLGRRLFSYVRNPRIPFLVRVKFTATSIKRMFDAFMMMALLHLWPEQVYRFSTMKRLLPVGARYPKDNKPGIFPFKVINKTLCNFPKMEEINICMRGSSFDLNNSKNFWFVYLGLFISVILFSKINSIA